MDLEMDENVIFQSMSDAKTVENNYSQNDKKRVRITKMNTRKQKKNRKSKTIRKTPYPKMEIADKDKDTKTPLRSILVVGGAKNTTNTTKKYKHHQSHHKNTTRVRFGKSKIRYYH